LGDIQGAKPGGGVGLVSAGSKIGGGRDIKFGGGGGGTRRFPPLWATPGRLLGPF